MRPRPRQGSVIAFDGDAGLGRIVDLDGVEFEFHCIEIADGSRRVDVGATISFEVLPRLGKYQAGHIEKR